MRIDIYGSRELQDIALALRNADRETRRAIRTFTKARIQKPWLEAINKKSSTVLENRVIAATATVAVSDQNISIRSASKGRRMSGGLNPKTDYMGVEFGKTPTRETYSRLSKKGTRHKVTRTVGTQLKPRTTKGYVFYPAARDMIPRLASLWVQTVVKTFADIFDGKG